MRIALGSDHRGFQIKAKLITLLTADGHEVEDFGTQSDQPVDRSSEVFLSAVPVSVWLSPPISFTVSELPLALMK